MAYKATISGWRDMGRNKSYFVAKTYRIKGLDEKICNSWNVYAWTGNTVEKNA